MTGRIVEEHTARTVQEVSEVPETKDKLEVVLQCFRTCSSQWHSFREKGLNQGEFHGQFYLDLLWPRLALSWEMIIFSNKANVVVTLPSRLWKTMIENRRIEVLDLPSSSPDLLENAGSMLRNLVYDGFDTFRIDELELHVLECSKNFDAQRRPNQATVGKQHMPRLQIESKIYSKRPRLQPKIKIFKRSRFFQGGF